MNDNQILIIVLFVSMMLAAALICRIGVLIHIRKEKKKEADLMDSAIDAFFESVKIGKTTFCGLSATAMAFRDNGFDELSATARAFKDNGMTFACGSSGWVKDDIITKEDKFIEALYDFNNCTGATERAFNEAMIITEEKEMKIRQTKKTLSTRITNIEIQVAELIKFTKPQRTEKEKVGMKALNRKLMFDRLLQATGKVPTKAQVKESLEIIDNDL